MSKKSSYYSILVKYFFVAIYNCQPSANALRTLSMIKRSEKITVRDEIGPFG